MILVGGAQSCALSNVTHTYNNIVLHTNPSTRVVENSVELIAYIAYMAIIAYIEQQEEALWRGQHQIQSDSLLEVL